MMLQAYCVTLGIVTMLECHVLLPNPATNDKQRILLLLYATNVSVVEGSGFVPPPHAHELN